MLIKDKYILITPNEQNQLWKHDDNCYCKFGRICENRDIIEEINNKPYIIEVPNDCPCRRPNTFTSCMGICGGKKEVIINDYEVWDFKKMLMLKRENNWGNSNYTENWDLIESLEKFLKDNNIKYCFKLKIKENKWTNINV